MRTKRYLALTALAGVGVLSLGASSAEASDPWGVGVRIGRATLQLGHSHGYYAGRPLRGGIATHPRGHYDWHDTSHYDWHPGEFHRHGNHYHYVPGHFDLHRDGHWDYHRGGHWNGHRGRHGGHGRGFYRVR